MNLSIFVFLIILILIIIICINCLTVENFQHQVYKSHIVQLKKEVLNPLKISCGKTGSFTANFFKVFSNKYPLLIDNIDGYSMENLELLTKDLTDICVTQLNLLQSCYRGEPPYDEEYENLRLICNLNLDVPTLIINPYSNINSWQDLKNKTVLIHTEKKESYYNFKTLIGSIKLNIKDIIIIEGDMFSDEVYEQFQSGKIDACYLTTIHPNKKLKQLYKQFQYKVLGTKGLNIQALKMKSPFIVSTGIDLRNYDMGEEQLTLYVESIGFPLCLATTNSVDSISLYRFINALFQNLEYVKKNFDKIIYPKKQAMSFYNMEAREQLEKPTLEYLIPSRLYNLRFSVPLHKAVKAYYYKLGMITNNPDWNCANYLPEGSSKDITRSGMNCNFMKIPSDSPLVYYHQFKNIKPALMVQQSKNMINNPNLQEIQIIGTEANINKNCSIIGDEKYSGYCASSKKDPLCDSGCSTEIPGVGKVCCTNSCCNKKDTGPEKQDIVYYPDKLFK